MAPNLQILYVDPDPENLLGFQVSLSNSFDIVTALDINTANEILLSNPNIGVVLVDYRFPDNYSLLLTQSIGVDYPHLVFVVTSAWADIEEVSNTIRSKQFFGFVTKPWNFTELKLVLRNALEYIKVLREKNQLVEEKRLSGTDLKLNRSKLNEIDDQR